MRNDFKPNRLVLALGLLTALALAAPAPAGESSGPEATAAKAILDASGVKGGLCVHLGCGREGSAGLTAALAEGSELLVHGLALDDAALGRARAAIDARGVAGRALAEKLSEKALPYLPDLARLVVVEDLGALAAAGVSKDEVLRVLAPGGALCTLEGGKWTATVKPRPKDMDEWTHPHRGPDNNLSSNDKVLSFPIGYRWIEGVPMNMGGWASTRAVVSSGGRVFALSVNELGRKTKGGVLTARDAWSGLPLWRAECEAIYGGAELDWRNVWPLVAAERRVYSTQKGVLTVFDAALGKVETTCPTKFPPRRLLLAGGSLVAGCWEKSESKGGYEADDLRATWWPVGEGSVEAFDPETGKPLWTLPLVALTMAASDGTLYVLTHKGNPPTERNLVAVELATGKEKWRVPHTAFGPEADIYLNLAGPGCAVLTKSRGKAAAFVVSAADGKILHSLPTSAARMIVGNELWCSDGRYDLKTGKKNPGGGVGGAHVGGIVGGCVPAIVVGGRYVTASRGGQYEQLYEGGSRPATRLSYQGARGGCIQGMVPANGMFYTAQNACACNPTQVGGFIAAGPCGELPGAAEFAAARPVEKGPAFGAADSSAAAADEWPTYRQNAERSSGSSALAVPDGLKQLWKVQLAKPGEGRLGEAWLARMGMAQPLSGPAVAGGLAVACGTNSGQVFAVNSETGAKAWTVSLGSRIDSPPTLHKGLCLVGCHDGWVYALRAKDGALAYRVRIAPRERRMVAYGMVESVWPAVGAVLVHDGAAYATAGRSTRSDGGIALVAFKPESGETLWARALGEDMANLNDALSVRNGELAWHHHRMDLKTGKPLGPVQPIQYHGSMIDGSWLNGFGTRFGRAYMFGKACSNMMAWDDKLVAFPGMAVPRAKAEIPKPEKLAGGVKNPDEFKKDEVLWGTELEPATPWARPGTMAVTGNAVLYAGGVYTYCDGSKYAGSSLWIKSAADGKKLQPTIKLEAVPAFEGLAVAGGRVYLSQQDGTLVCWGK
ncbi:MAG TPA: PQQ-binding-like beta-propeller repeat protein [Planctomycetota bacterium]|nr:PQQ-binding-like beta-propeller repeat protein [Planctomycetota bacterium]